MTPSVFTSSHQKKEKFRSSEGSREGSGNLSPFDLNLLSDSIDSDFPHRPAFHCLLCFGLIHLKS